MQSNNESNNEFYPKLDILPTPQRRLWDELIDVPPTFTLYGGTAVALHLGHRQSVDFDFFGGEKFDPQRLYQVIPFLKNSEVIQMESHTLTCIIERDGGVLVSFFGVPELKRIKPPHFIRENRVKIASLVDLAGVKAAVVQKRAEAKDYLDLDAIIQHTEIDLPSALTAGRIIYGSSFNPLITLKALSYHEDGNLVTLPQEVRVRLTRAVDAVDPNNLPPIKDASVASLGAFSNPETLP